VTPEGLVYRPELLNEAEERALFDELGRLDFHEIRMRGVVAKRAARHFGVDYDYERRSPVQAAEPIPAWLVPVRERAAEFAGVEAEELAEILVQRYPPGAQIGWHRDAPAFGVVVGISLGSSARMRFRRDKGGVRHTFELELEPRSGYILAGEARTAWQHHLLPAKALRYSITFRTLRRPGHARPGLMAADPSAALDHASAIRGLLWIVAGVLAAVELLLNATAQSYDVRTALPARANAQASSIVSSSPSS